MPRHVTVIAWPGWRAARLTSVEDSASTSAGGFIELTNAQPVRAAPVAPKKGLLRRVVDVVTFRGSAAPAAKPAEAASVPAAATSPDGAAAGPSVEEMTGRLAATMEVTDNDLRALADARNEFIGVEHLGEKELIDIRDKLERECGRDVPDLHKGIGRVLGRR